MRVSSRFFVQAAAWLVVPAGAAIFTQVQPARAETILDTGIVPFRCCYFTGVTGDANSYGWGVNSMAVQFQIDGWMTITSIETFSYVNPSGGGLLTNRIYRASVLPGASTVLYEGVTSVSDPAPVDPVVDELPQFIGATGLSWTLAPGTYWATFETPSGSTLDVHPVTTFAVSPLYAVSEASSGNSWSIATYPLNARIEGVAVAVLPEPITWSYLLFGFGIAGAVMRRSKLRKAPDGLLETIASAR